MQSVGFYNGISISITESREATTSGQSVPCISVKTPSENPSQTTPIRRYERCRPPPSYMTYDQHSELG